MSTVLNESESIANVVTSVIAVTVAALGAPWGNTEHRRSAFSLIAEQASFLIRQ